MRRRPAPSADRTASSRMRTVARASSRLATLAQQMRSTNPTTPRNSIDVSRRSLPMIESCIRSSVTPRPLLVCGNSRARPSATAPRSACGRLDRHARLHASDHLEHVGGAGAWRKVDERPHRPDAALPHQLEVLRHDADHGAERPVEADLAADDARIGVEAGAPERLAHHDHVGALGLVVCGERPAGNRRDAKHVEDPGGDPLPRDRLGVAVGAGHHHAADARRETRRSSRTCGCGRSSRAC